MFLAFEQNKIDIKHQILHIIALFIAMISLLFSPVLCLYISIALVLFYCTTNNNINIRPLILLYLSMAILCMSLLNTGATNFTVRSDDFISYYNNYLFSYNGEYEEIFEYGKGIEIFVPILNLIFSVIIDEPYPYVLKLLHSICLFSLVLTLVIQIGNYHKIGFNSTSLLFLCVIVLIQPLLMIQFLRQAYGALFVLIAIFTMDKRLRRLLLILAVMSHITSIIMYPILKYLTTPLDRKRFYRDFLLLAVTACSAILFIKVLGPYILNIDTFVTNKMRYPIIMFQEKDNIIKSIIINAKMLFYIIPLVLVTLFINNKSSRLSYNILMVVTIGVCLSAFPGVGNRLLFPVLSIFLGYFYFSQIMSKSKTTGFSILLVGFMFLVSSKWGATNNYNQRFPLFSNQPGYYLSTLSETQLSIDRKKVDE